MINLKELRKEKKCTQLDVANYLNVARTTYSAYEQGANEPDSNTLIKLSKYFNKSIDYLLENEIADKVDLTSLTVAQKELVEIIQNLNSKNCERLLAYAEGLLVGQEEHQKIIKKLKNL